MSDPINNATSIVNDGETVILHGTRLTGIKSLAPAIKKASRLVIWRGLAAIAFDWGLIVGSFAAAVITGHPLVWILAAILIAGRQHALLVLMHEATHYRILHNRSWNDRLSNWLFAWPLLVSTDGFRRDHMPHHFNLFTEKDPEWTRKRLRTEFQFPLSSGRFLWILAKDILGFSTFKMVMLLANFSGAQQEARKVDRRTAFLQTTERVIYYAIAVGLTTYFRLWLPVLLLWFVPAFTLLFAILRIRNVSEHSNIGMENDLHMARNVVAPSMLERLVLAPHNVGLHLVHHLYPSVPFYNLQYVHNQLQQIPEYATESLHVDNYFGWTGRNVLTDIAIQRDNEMKHWKPSEPPKEHAPDASSILQETEALRGEVQTLIRDVPANETHTDQSEPVQAH